MIIVLCGTKGSGKDTIGDILANNYGFTKEAFANPMKTMVKLAFPAFTDDDLYGPSKNREHGYKQYPLTSCPWCGGGITYDKYDNRDGKFELLPADQINTHRRCTTEPDHDWLPEFVSPRIALQTLGTEWGRKLCDNVWIDAAFKRMDHAREQAKAQRLGVLYSSRPDDLPVPPLPNFAVTDGRFPNEIRRSNELGAMTVKLTRNENNSADTHESETALRTIPRSAYRYILDNAELPLEQLPAEIEKMLATLKEIP